MSEGHGASFDQQPELEQKKLVGQAAAIKRVEPGNIEELKVLKAILDDPGINYWMEGCRGSTVVEMKKWARNERKEKEYLFAVCGSEGVPSLEVGKIQGFINIYPSKTVPGAYEVGYAKKPDAQPHQIASGLRQALIQFNKTFFIRDDEKKRPSIRVVADPSVEKEGKKVPNPNSIEVCKAAGFIQKGEIWELNWQILNEKLIKNSYFEDFNFSKKRAIRKR